MFVALDKLQNQGIKKVIVAVPERSIGSSFKDTNLSTYGFFADWKVNPKYNLCSAGSDTSKVKAFKNFMASDEKIVVVTHATLRINVRSGVYLLPSNLFWRHALRCSENHSGFSKSLTLLRGVIFKHFGNSKIKYFYKPFNGTLTVCPDMW